MSAYPPNSSSTFSGVQTQPPFYPQSNHPAQSPFQAQQPYPVPQPFSGQSPYPGQQPFPGQPPYPGQQPFPGQLPYPANQNTSPEKMSGNNSGYPSAAGYPYPGTQTSPGYPGSGGGAPPPGLNPQVCSGLPGPDLSQIEKIPGYEYLTFQEEIITPPTAPVWQPEVHENKQLENLPSLTEEEVRDAVIQYSSENCCYGSAAAKNMVITNIQMSSAFHYKLETFGEKRESAWRFEPYKGQPVDGSMNGPAPGAWDVVANPPSYFSGSKVKMEVPHTAFVKPCHTCVGNCRVRCDECQGNGRNQCTWCKGRGFRSTFDNDRCNSCEGTGFNRCTWCHGTGQKKCKTCDGHGQLKGFVELIITWTNHTDDYISETSRLPKELVRSVTGQTAFEEENPRVYPILNSSDQAVRNASQEYVNKHSSAFPNERILKQRQCLRLIPIAEVSYSWKDNPGQFYVYGYEHKVYFKKYPQKCCCCTIL